MTPTIPETVTYRTSLIPLNVEAVEEKYNATFVGDFCLRTKHGDWANAPAAIFWQENPPVEGYSNYFALIIQNDTYYITSGASGVAEPINGIVTPDGEVLYSRYRHDYRPSKCGNYAVDGGRDYLKITGDFRSCTYVDLIVDGPTIRVVQSDKHV